MGKRLKTALRTGIPFGITMGAIFYAQHRQPVALLGGVVAGIFFGIAMACLQIRAEKRIENSGLPPGNMTPIQERTISLPLDHKLALDRVRSALTVIRNIRPSSIEVTANLISASTGMTWQSFGERISVDLRQTETAVLVHVISRPKLATTIMDSGKGYENVELFARALQSADA